MSATNCHSGSSPRHRRPAAHLTFKIVARAHLSFAPPGGFAKGQSDSRSHHAGPSHGHSPLRESGQTALSLPGGSQPFGDTGQGGISLVAVLTLGSPSLSLGTAMVMYSTARPAVDQIPVSHGATRVASHTVPFKSGHSVALFNTLDRWHSKPRCPPGLRNTAELFLRLS